MIRLLVKRLLAVLPPPLDVRVSDFARYLGSKRHRENARATRRALGELAHPSHVLAGPFARLAYPVHSSAQGGLVPKLVGSYEQELIGVVEEIIALEPNLIIDIGAADGYYVSGFAMRIPGVRVVAYETEKTLRGVARAVAAANSVLDRVDIRGECTVDELSRLLHDAAADSSVLTRTVIVCDVEGFEDQLLDCARIVELAHVFILCEVHEAIVPGVGARLRSRFRPTHNISEMVSRRRTSNDVPLGLHLSYPDMVLGEGRTHQMSWYIMRPTGMGR